MWLSDLYSPANAKGLQEPHNKGSDTSIYPLNAVFLKAVVDKSSALWLKAFACYSFRNVGEKAVCFPVFK